MVEKPVAQEPRHGEDHWVDPDNDSEMDKINVIFRGSISITSKTQGKKLKREREREINLTQRIEPKRRMNWSNTNIPFGPEDHLGTELSNQNLPFMVKLPIGHHKVDKNLVGNEASLNLKMRKTFIKMGLNLADLTPVHEMFHGVILGQSSTLIGRIDLKVSCGLGDNKRKEKLTFEVTSFDIGYNCILGRLFHIKFITVIHTAYATMKMPGPKGIISIKADQRDTLACEKTSL
jgi:hypothetical protein